MLNTLTLYTSNFMVFLIFVSINFEWEPEKLSL